MTARNSCHHASAQTMDLGLATYWLGLCCLKIWARLYQKVRISSSRRFGQVSQ